MTRADGADAMALELTRRFTGLAGVIGLFPRHAVATAILTLVADDATAARGAVEVDAHGPTLRVSARLATSRRVPIEEVIEKATAAVREVAGTHPSALDLEVAYYRVTGVGADRRQAPA